MELQKSLLSCINDNGGNNEKQIRKLRCEYLKTWVGIFQAGISKACQVYILQTYELRV